MKNIVLLLILSTHLFGQNSHAIKYIDRHMGKKVGNGKCIELVKGIFHTTYGKENLIDSSEIQPGDIVSFKKVIRFDGIKLPNHVVVIYSINNGKIIIAQQNSQGSLKESKVELVNLNELYRPSYVSNIDISYYRMR